MGDTLAGLGRAEHCRVGRWARHAALTRPSPVLPNAVMADSPPLSDRALKYGRNVVAVSGVIIVLAWMPEIDIDRFKPFGFEFTEEGERSVWIVLLVVLGYYFVMWVIAARIDYVTWRQETEGERADLRIATKPASASLDEDEIARRPSRTATLRVLRPFRYATWRMWFDIGFPCVMFVFALVAAARSI